MALIIQANDGRIAYRDLIDKLMRDGERVAPRGQPTREIRNVIVSIRNPELAVPVGTGRKMNMGIGYAEATQLLGGISCLWQLDQVSANRFNRFATGDRLEGAYGPKISSRMIDVLNCLYTDSDTRQAYATIFRDELPNADVPCTIGFGFSIRDGHLSMDVHMRSNDVWLGFPYDVWQFTRLQMVVAYVLGVPLGPYTHYVNSMHLYERNYETAERLFNSVIVPASQPLALVNFVEYMTPATFNSVYQRWRYVSNIARLTLSGAHFDVPDDFINGINEVQAHVPPWPLDYTLCGHCGYVLPPREFDDVYTSRCKRCG